VAAAKTTVHMYVSFVASTEHYAVSPRMQELNAQNLIAAIGGHIAIGASRITFREGSESYESGARRHRVSLTRRRLAAFRSLS
jgi:hypothetical protein